MAAPVTPAALTAFEVTIAFWMNRRRRRPLCEFKGTCGSFFGDARAVSEEE